VTTSIAARRPVCPPPLPLDSPLSRAALQSHRIDLFDTPEQMCYRGNTVACGHADTLELIDDFAGYSIYGTQPPAAA